MCRDKGTIGHISYRGSHVFVGNYNVVTNYSIQLSVFAGKGTEQPSCMLRSTGNGSHVVNTCSLF